MQLSDTQVADFRSVVMDYYHSRGRHDMPWRQPEPDGMFDPYKILVSELMLQQTQVSRVIPKYQQFLELFPTVQALASASLAAVLTAWNGLGYNRRAKFLHQAARVIVNEFGGTFPQTVEDLVRLPGVGVNTAGAIGAYAFNAPMIFLETNIRTVYIHHFFADRTGIDDSELRPLLEATNDVENPRVWYWALMDYGAHLKQTAGNLNKLSVHHVQQSQFKGSKRQLRGQVIRELSLETLTADTLAARIPDPRLDAVLADLLDEGLIVQRSGMYMLPD